MPVRATRYIRKMRGGAQAHLVAASDGAFYVVKAASNPQGRRILVNEWIAGVFLRYLQISTPDCAIIEITPDFLAEFPQFSIQLGSTLTPIEPGWHFGSRYPGDPAVLTVFDFVADDQLRACANPWEFAAILPFDKWTANADARQSIFYRARVKAANSNYETTAVVTRMIDHGFVFAGPVWQFQDAPLQGIYPRHMVYNGIRSWDDFEPWLERVIHFPESVFDEAQRQIPRQWIGEDGDLLDALLEKLHRRRAQTPRLIEDIRRARPQVFPNWTK